MRARQSPLSNQVFGFLPGRAGGAAALRLSRTRRPAPTRGRTGSAMSASVRVCSSDVRQAVPKRSRVCARIIRARVRVCFMRSVLYCFRARTSRNTRYDESRLRWRRWHSSSLRSVERASARIDCNRVDRHASVTHECESTITCVMCEITANSRERDEIPTTPPLSSP
jgi:hypothetical protein